MNVVPKAAWIDLAREAPFHLGSVEVRPATREFLAGEKREVLEPRVMQVLTALAQKRGQVVSRDDLIVTCWESRSVGDDSINRCISRIRRLSESYGGFDIETIPRVGYRLTATASVSSEETPTTVVAPQRRWHLLAAGIAAVVLIAAGLITFTRSHVKELIVEAPVRHRIAVLPFSPLSPGPETQLYGDTIATAVAETLSKVGQPVVAPSQSFQFRGAAKARAAQSLQAMYIIDGDVLRENGRVRVSVRFDDAIRGTTIFAHTFDEPVRRADALPDRVAAYIAAMSWGSDVTAWKAAHAPVLFRAFEQQQRGDLYAAYITARELAQAEPNDADVQRIYASNIINLIYASQAKRKLSLIADARAAAEKALKLKPTSCEPGATLASATPHVLWGVREDYLRKALTTNPESVGVAEYLTWLLTDTGRFRDAEPWARLAYERFPYHTVSYERRSEQLLGAGNAAEALQIVPAARRLWPDDPLFLELTFEALLTGGGNTDAFFADPDVVQLLPAPRAALWKSMLRAVREHRPNDIAAVSRLCVDPGKDWWGCMITSAMSGKLDDAFRIADTAYPDQRAPTPEAVMQKWLANPELPYTRYLFMPATAAMRSDPRFQNLVERIGLLPYWRSAHRAPDFCATEQVPVCQTLK